MWLPRIQLEGQGDSQAGEDGTKGEARQRELRQSYHVPWVMYLLSFLKTLQNCCYDEEQESEMIYWSRFPQGSASPQHFRGAELQAMTSVYQ